MSEESNLVIMATGKLHDLIEEAGELQRASSTAKSKYDKSRMKLQKLIHDKYGDDVDVYADNFYVNNKHDLSDIIDVVDLFNRVKDNKTRRKVATVLITAAKKFLKEADLKALVKEAVPNKKPTFHVFRISRDLPPKRGGD